MKTLDEVIELSERCTLPYPGDCLNCEYFEDDTGYDCRCKIIADALHYLREYKQTRQDLLDGMKRLEGKELMYIHMLANLEDNPPLTWDELKQMIDSIVWLEWSSDGKWVQIIRGFNDRIEYYRFGTDEFFYITKEEYVPDKWQAYRKEME